MKSLPETGLDISQAARVLEKYEKLHPVGRLPADYLIPILQEIQEAYGYLPPPVLSWVGERTGIPTSRMYGVITFYAQFYTEPHGKHLVRCCRGTACHVRGGKKVITAVRNVLGVEDGATTEDMLFSFETVACLGACALSPIMVVDNTYYGNMSTRKAEQILRGIEGKESR